MALTKLLWAMLCLGFAVVFLGSAPSGEPFVAGAHAQAKKPTRPRPPSAAERYERSVLRHKEHQLMRHRRHELHEAARDKRQASYLKRELGEHHKSKVKAPAKVAAKVVLKK